MAKGDTFKSQTEAVFNLLSTEPLSRTQSSEVLSRMLGINPRTVRACILHLRERKWIDCRFKFITNVLDGKRVTVREVGILDPKGRIEVPEQHFPRRAYRGKKSYIKENEDLKAEVVRLRGVVDELEHRLTSLSSYRP